MAIAWYCTMTLSFISMVFYRYRYRVYLRTSVLWILKLCFAYPQILTCSATHACFDTFVHLFCFSAVLAPLSLHPCFSLVFDTLCTHCVHTPGHPQLFRGNGGFCYPPGIPPNLYPYLHCNTPLYSVLDLRHREWAWVLMEY
jgi:hypothetical protein